MVPLKLIGFIIIGFMLLCTVQALGELAVLYPVNGAFFTYACRFLDESWYGSFWMMNLRIRMANGVLGDSRWDGIMP